jgi:hypothetical protein
MKWDVFPLLSSPLSLISSRLISSHLRRKERRAEEKGKGGAGGKGMEERRGGRASAVAVAICNEPTTRYQFVHN